jgi:hypothetical protein
MTMTCKVEVAAAASGQSAAGNIKVSGAAQLVVDCYDYCEVTLPSGDSAGGCVRVNVQPSAVDQIALLVIAADSYAPEISYSTGKDTDYAHRMKLETIHVFLPGSALFSSADQASYLYFWNTTQNPVCIHILVGRSGMAPCEDQANGLPGQQGGPPNEREPADDGGEPDEEPSKPSGGYGGSTPPPQKPPPKPGQTSAQQGGGRRY